VKIKWDPQKTSKTAGFTLIELLIALVLSIVIVGAVYATFNTQQKSFSLTNQKTDMQQQLRGATNLIIRDIRMASCGFQGGQLSYYDGSGTAYFNALKPTDGGTAGTDRIDIMYGDYSVKTKIAQPMPTSSAVCKVDDTTGFQVGDIVLISRPDGSFGSLIEVTQVQVAALKLQHNPGGGTINPPGGHNIFPTGGYGTNSTVTKFACHSYFIDSTDPVHPVLMLDPDGPLGAGTPQRLAENVEDLQIAYEDKNGTWFCYDATHIAAPATISDIRAARVNLLARTSIPDPDFTGQRPAVEDRAAATATDNYRRRTLRSMVKIRNLGL